MRPDTRFPITLPATKGYSTPRSVEITPASTPRSVERQASSSMALPPGHSTPRAVEWPASSSVARPPGSPRTVRISDGLFHPTSSVGASRQFERQEAFSSVLGGRNVSKMTCAPSLVGSTRLSAEREASPGTQDGWRKVIAPMSPSFPPGRSTPIVTRHSEGSDASSVVWEGMRKLPSPSLCQGTGTKELVSHISSLLNEHGKHVISHLEEQGRALEQIQIQLGKQQQHNVASAEACASRQAGPGPWQDGSDCPSSQFKDDGEMTALILTCLQQYHQRHQGDDRVSSQVSYCVSEPAPDYHPDRFPSLCQVSAGSLREDSSLTSPLLTKKSNQPSEGGRSVDFAGQASMNSTAAQSEVDSISVPVIPHRLMQLGRKTAETRMASLFPREQEHFRQHDYDVEDLYYKSGIWQAIARDDYFKNFMLLAVVVNVFWIGYETDYNKALLLSLADPIFQIVDNTFCAIFVFEMLARLLAFETKTHGFRDRWFVFDSALVLMMVGNCWVLPAWYAFMGSIDGGAVFTQHSQLLRMVRLVRLVKVVRSARLLHTIPEFTVLISAMVHACRSLLAVWCMILLTIYAFGVLFTMLLDGNDVAIGVFDGVLQSMNTLIITVLCGPDAALMRSILKVHWTYYALFLIFLLISMLVLLNMLTAMLCDVVGKSSDASREGALLKHMEDQLARLAEALDSDGDGRLDRDEFEIIMQDPLMTGTLIELDVDIMSVANFAKFIYDQVDSISYSDFALLVSRFRATKLATGKDIMDLRHYLTMEILELALLTSNTLEHSAVRS